MDLASGGSNPPAPTGFVSRSPAAGAAAGGGRARRATSLCVGAALAGAIAAAGCGTRDAPEASGSSAIELRVRVDPPAPLPGDTVSVRVEGERRDGPIGAFRLDVVFDPDSVRFLALDSLPPHLVVNEAAADSGRIRVAGAWPQGLGPTLFAGRFELHGGAADPVDVRVLEAVEPDLRRLPVRRSGR